MTVTPGALAWSTDNCTVGRAMEVLGERWTFVVLREVFNGIRRFDDMRRHTGIPRQVLTNRLTLLVEQGVLRRVGYREPGQRERHEAQQPCCETERDERRCQRNRHDVGQRREERHRMKGVGQQRQQERLRREADDERSQNQRFGVPPGEIRRLNGPQGRPGKDEHPDDR